MSEFIGSRISLISKSDIKYVGTLHEINSENSTVALENVKSYGTEGRRGDPSQEVPPSDQIYEYIVFRGSDVKDLTIIEQAPKESKPPQMPNDPAILGSARPPQHQQPPPPQGHNQQWRGPPPPQTFSPYGDYPQQNPRFAPPGGPHGFPGAPGAVPGYGMNFGGPPPPEWYPPPGHGFPQGPHGGPGGPNGQHGQHGPGGPGHFPQQTQQGPMGAPSPMQENQHPGQKQGMSNQWAAIEPPPLPTDSKPSELSGTPATGIVSDTNAPPLPKESKPEQPKIPTEPKGARVQGPPKNPRVALPLAARPSAQAGAKPVGQTQAAQNTAQSTQNATEAAAAAVAAAMAKLGPVPGKPAGQLAPSGAVDNLTRKVGEMSTTDTGRGRGGQRGVSARGGRGPRRGGPPRHGVEVPTTDFDFESSNAKFNKQDLVKQAIASGSPLGTPTDELPTGENGLNGDASGVGLGGAASSNTADDDVVIPGANVKKYNKTSSFFDDLSSELKDRQAAQDDGKRLGGADFRFEERKRNMETFGESSPFRGRGGMRGSGTRGRGYGRGGPRGGSGFRGRGLSTSTPGDV